MRKKKRHIVPLFSKQHAVQASVIISFILNFILILGMLYGQRRGFWSSGRSHWLVYSKFFLWHFVCNTILLYLLHIYNFRIIRFRQKAAGIPWSASLGTLLICALISPVLAQVQWLAIGGEKGLAEGAFIIFNFIKDTILGIIVILVTRNTYSNYKREQAIIANQKLMEENIRVRFEALKNQLDPHFLFNSLNTLNGLIGIDDDKAHEYVDNLSSVFRYTLQNKQLLSLEEELRFVEAYTTLLKIRYGENLNVLYAVEEQYTHDLIMPVSIQLLVENAVKHNAVSNKTPLTIEIRSTQNRSIIVSNRKKPKVEAIPGSGVGLANLADRYSLLFKKSIRITDADGLFSVEIPLIDESENFTII